MFTLQRDEAEYAFPTTSDNAPSSGSKGLELRDYFAARVLSGLLANPSTKVEDNDAIRSISEFSYDLADAMMKARDGNT
jgi:hypothetical protein